MRVNTKCSIAIHCLIFISVYADKVKVTSELLAKTTGCNPVAIRQILNMLQKAGIIQVKRGIGGAYLQRNPQDISLWEIHCTLEPDGLNSLIALHPHSSAECPVGRCIYDVLNESYKKISDVMEKEMKKITLQDFLNCYYMQNK